MEIVINRNLIFAQNQRLETERLILRPVTLEDAKAMYEYASDEETVTYVFPLHQSIKDTRESIANYFLTAPLGKYGIEEKESGQFIGTIDLRVEEQHSNGEIGYTLNKNYWGKGYIPEAAKALLRLGFEELKLIRICAVHDIDNPNSGRVMEKIGMKVEGTVPNARMWKGKITTDILRGITVEEWQKLQGER
ncbi:GNAT family N-acetyltransferase [Enterococcus termitis]|jgi:ribosomal-protein-alanine N-acetyltransferase|uniref:GNAT family N-acetyltransferase n=1 Tax=Enterococcus termitis TaxID=332950 RepID=A0A1E5GWF1_9ENTE|nr:GNAT family N-acetyltransferase [Enterococcus termitis]OEG16640.1 GNAT family N-acetyltransferase [Enterococcus termitis]OJG99328.1 acetyltransferase [Enterococcus termitis]